MFFPRRDGADIVCAFAMGCIELARSSHYIRSMHFANQPASQPARRLGMLFFTSKFTQQITKELWEQLWTYDGSNFLYRISQWEQYTESIQSTDYCKLSMALTKQTTQYQFFVSYVFHFQKWLNRRRIERKLKGIIIFGVSLVRKVIVKPFWSSRSI